jgi:hypothetical protein
MKTVMKVISGTIVWVSTASHMLPLVCRDPLACDTTPGQTVVLPQAAMVAMGAAIEALEMPLKIKSSHS